MTNTAARAATTARLALVGDRSPNVASHTRVPLLLNALAERERLVLDAYWIPSQDAVADDAVRGFDAVWVLPGGRTAARRACCPRSAPHARRGFRSSARAAASSTRFSNTPARCAG